MNNTKVSVIIALYNAEVYLKRCLDSLLAQTMKDFDVIIVDDGSTDRSLSVCQEYADRDRRFRVFHKENGGVSSARQFGIDQLRGAKYSIHLDPDDWVEPHMLECLYRKAEETGAEMVICDYWTDGRSHSTLRKQDPGSEDPKDVLAALFQRLHGSLWNKLILSACYKEFNIKFPQGLNYCEDFYVNTCLLQRIHKVAYLPMAFYHYDQYSNNQAETRRRDPDHIIATRVGIVNRVRQVVGEDLKDWRYYIFEIGKAYSLLIWTAISNAEYRSLFSQIPFSVLLHNHEKYRQAFWVVLTARCFLPLSFARCFISLENKPKYFIKRMIGRR